MRPTTLPDRSPSLLREPRPEPVRTFLPEVQALRAVAVSLVVVYHFWPRLLPGGFVGVDVFFVISGFLITSHLHREVVDRGRIGLAAFYARRARRLLPASALVLLATAGAAFVLLPVTRWATTATDIVASTFYVQNWVLAERAVDYSASGDAASAVQHFWSLSVEEQFYLGWPALILLLLVLARRLPGIRRDAVLLGGILVVTVASLAYSVYVTAADPEAAYFLTPARIWELGAGAALALWSQGRTTRHLWAGPERRTALRWAGLAAVVVPAFALSAGSAFPGYLALLPVLGTVAVIAAGDTGPQDPSSRLFGLPPVQFLGNVSYALYLWHWPVIVMAPFALAGAVADIEKLALVALCVVLAWLTQLAVETPAQTWRLLDRPAATAVSAIVAMAVVSGVAVLQMQAVGEREETAEVALRAAQEDPCFGAAALDPDGPSCRDVFGTPAALTPVPGDEPWFVDPACEVSEEPLRVATCRYGSGAPTATVALVGDSHAEHWRGAVHRLAEANGWELIETMRGACPVSSAPVVAFNDKPVDGAGCLAWGEQVTELIEAEAPDAVFTSAFVPAMTFGGPGPGTSMQKGSAGFIETWTEWADDGALVFVLRDVPTTGGRHGPECLALNADAPLECATARRDAVRPDATTLAASRIASDRVHLVDLSDHFCDETTCYAAIGQAVVYHDVDHMSAAFSRSLAPYVLDRIAPVWSRGTGPS